MGRKCKVAGCKTGFNGYINIERISLFSFPKNLEQRKVWVDCLPNVGLKVEDITKNSRVCAKHWKGWEEGKVPWKVAMGGHVIPTIPPNNFVLTGGRIPVPSSTILRKKLLGVQNDCKSEIDGWMATDTITGFTLFCEEAKHYLGGNKWTFELDDTKEGQECIRFVFLPDLPTLEENRHLFSITVFFNMTVKLFSNLTGDIPDNSLSWIFGNEDKPPVLEYWSQFVTLVSQCSTGVWVDGNNYNQRVYLINDLHQLFPEESGETILSSNSASSNYEEKNTESIIDNFDKDDRRFQILGLTQELYRVIFQRNQLIKKMQQLNELAIIDMDVFSLIQGVDINPEGKTELDKVSKLVQTIMNDLEIGGSLDVLLPVLVKQYWNLMDNDNPFQSKPPYIPNNSSLPQDKLETRVEDTEEEEMNGHSNCGVIKDGSDQCLVVNTFQGEEQKNQIDNNLDENVNDSHPLETNNNDDDNLKTKSFCEYCGKWIKSHYLNRHMLTKHNKEFPPESLLDCNICGQQFFDLKALNSHFTSKHNQRCSICGKWFKTPTCVKHHLNMYHTDHRPYQCSVCGKTFKYTNSFRKHRLTAHTEERPFKCSFCIKRFKTKCSLKTHEECVHLGKGKKLGRRRYDEFSGLFEFKKGEDKRYYCMVCNKSFHVWSYLRKHMIIHSDKRAFKCDICGNSYKAYGNLKRHIQFVHSEGTLYQCSLCPKSFKCKSVLKSHQLVHTKIRRFKCTLCDKKFKWLRSLQKHQVVHSEKILVNQSCG